jgi:hypothetical protein
MNYPLAAQQSLTNFYQSVEHRNPALALIMSDDIRTVALYGLAGDRTRAYDAVIRLRDRADTLPIPFPRMLDRALEELGYSLLDVIRQRNER